MIFDLSSSTNWTTMKVYIGVSGDLRIQNVISPTSPRLHRHLQRRLSYLPAYSHSPSQGSSSLGSERQPPSEQDLTKSISSCSNVQACGVSAPTKCPSSNAISANAREAIRRWGCWYSLLTYVIATVFFEVEWGVDSEARR